MQKLYNLTKKEIEKKKEKMIKILVELIINGTISSQQSIQIINKYKG